MNCIQDSSQIRCYQCNYLGHTAKFCNNKNQTAKREKAKLSFNRRGQDNYQLTQNAEVLLKKDQIENCRGDDEKQFNIYFKDDVERSDNFQLDSSEDDNVDLPFLHQYFVYLKYRESEKCVYISHERLLCYFMIYS